MVSTWISLVSAAVQFAGGLTLLFASDSVLPRLAPGFPPSAAWLGQALGASWLGFAALNWLYRRALLGGIYGRPVVFANFALYFICATSLFQAARGAGSPAALRALAAAALALAVVYGLLLFRGPAPGDLAKHGGR